MFIVHGKEYNNAIDNVFARVPETHEQLSIQTFALASIFQCVIVLLIQRMILDVIPSSAGC